MGAEAETIVAKLKEIIAEQLGIKEEEIVPEASFVDDLGADSLDLVELIMALEEEFDTEISGRRCGKNSNGSGRHRLHIRKA